MKKSEFITFRTNPETKKALEQIASEKKWTITFLVEDIIDQWLQEQGSCEESKEQ